MSANRTADLAVTVLGAGFSPVAPGTCGGAVGLLLALLTARAAGRIGVAAGAAALSLLCLALAPYAIRRFGSPDPSPFVLDEAAGSFLLVAIAAPAAFAGIASPGAGLLWIVLAFALFRALDAWKPFPIGPIERLPGGYGILLDDLAAAAASSTLTWAAR